MSKAVPVRTSTRRVVTTAAMTTATGTIEIQQLPRPEKGPSDVVLRIDAVAICGTDLHIYDGSYPVTWPVVQGHEIAATVIETAQDGNLAIGDRVTINNVISCGTCVACRKGRPNTCVYMDAYGVHRHGGLQEELVLPESRCIPVGDLSSTATALVDTVAVGLRAVTRPGITKDDRVVVLGGGAIGLGAVIACRDIGAEVLVVELHENRRQLAARFGAAVTVADIADAETAVLEWTSGDLADVVIEATGSGFVASKAFDLVGTAGRLSFVGVSQQPVTFNQRTITAKELDIFGSRSSLDFPGAVELIRRHEQDVLSLVSHRYPLARTQEAIRHATESPAEVVKAVIDVH